MDTIRYIEESGLIPVITLREYDKAGQLGKALADGGLPIAEITFRTADAEKAIYKMKSSCPEMAVGAGTVLSKEQARTAIEAGADFIVAPGLNVEMVMYCQERGMTVIPGCATPTEIEAALRCGVTLLKFFPAEQMGGIPMLKALQGPYKKVRFVPTGGINENNIGDYLSLKSVAACGGSFMVKEEHLANGDWDKVTALCRSAKNKISKVRESREI